MGGSKDAGHTVTVQPLDRNGENSYNLSTFFPSTSLSGTEHGIDLDDLDKRSISTDKHGLTTTPTTDRSLRPAPTNDPRDPLNLSKSRKLLACFFLCFFGAMAAAAELILGAMLPVFSLEYAGIDPKTIIAFANIQLPAGTNPLAIVAILPNSPPIWKVYLLGSLPVLMIGVSNLIMVPLATAIGRRPVILGCGVIAISGCIWAGNSRSLDSHLLARCVQAIGAGTVESLIPFVISDITFSHQRNTWMSYVFATQGLIIVGLGFATPHIIIYLSWRWLYFITAIGGATFIFGVFAFLPETKWHRTADEIHGIPRNDHERTYAPRTWRDDLRLYSGQVEGRLGLRVLTDALSTMFYPQIIFVTLLNSTMIAATFAAGYTAAPPLIVQPWAWPFFNLTLCLIPILIASLGTILVTGRVADIVSNWGARRRPGGKRAAEDQLLNLILPTLSGLVGTLLFGVAGGSPTLYPWTMFLAGLGLMAFGFLGANTVGTVYVLECYPEMAGSALLNIASIRYIIAFFLSFRISEWIVGFGYSKSFLIYTGLMSGCAAMLPFLWWFGPAWKVKFPGKTTYI